MNRTWSDEELQQFLEDGVNDINDISPASEEELQTYRLLFDSLKEMRAETAVPLRPGFASRVTKKIVRKKWAEDILFYTLAAFITIAGAAVIYGLLLVIDRENAVKFSLNFAEYWWVFVFALIAVLSIQWLDQRLVHFKDF
jgi:hypothetical protein